MPLEDFEPAFFRVEEQDDIVIARFVNDRLTDELNVERMGEELFSLADQFQFRKVIVDMSAVQHMTSSSLGKLITMHRRLHRVEGRLALCHLTHGVQDVLETSRLIKYFNVAKDVESAKAVVQGSAD